MTKDIPTLPEWDPPRKSIKPVVTMRDELPFDLVKAVLDELKGREGFRVSFDHIDEETGFGIISACVARVEQVLKDG